MPPDSAHTTNRLTPAGASGKEGTLPRRAAIKRAIALNRRSGSCGSRYLIHRRASKIPAPDHDRELPRVAGRPGIAPVAARAGLYRHGKAHFQRGILTERLHTHRFVADDRRHQPCGFRGDNASPGPRVGEGRRRKVVAAAGQGGISTRELQQAHLAVSQYKAEAVMAGILVQGRKPQIAQLIEKLSDQSHSSPLAQPGTNENWQNAVRNRRRPDPGRCQGEAWGSGRYTRAGCRSKRPPRHHRDVRRPFRQQLRMKKPNKA